MDQKKSKKLLLNFAKIAISVALLYWVFQKIPFREVSSLWKDLNVFYLILAAFFFLASQIISTKRLGFFFHVQSFDLQFWSNLKLYFVGMFYNFFIPGGIGGDAYKIYLLNKKFNWSSKKLTSTLFNDRLIGLFAIVFLMLAFALFLLPQFKILIILAFLLFPFIIKLILKKIFPVYHSIFWKTFGISLLVQGFQISCFLLLLKSLHVENDFFSYSLLFLASSVLSLISFAGIGVREMLFLQASHFFHFSPEFSISASLLFTIITAFFSLLGIYFQIRKLNLKLEEKPN